MIIFRYLAKDVFVTLVSLTSLLLLIFMSNQFVQYLNRAAGGSIPGLFVMKLMMLELPTLMSLLLPLGFYVALLVAYGRLYADNEMTVLQGSGYSPSHLLMHSLLMASIVALLVTFIMLWASPLIAIERAKLLRHAGVKTLIQTVVPGRFRSLSDGRQLFYVEAMNHEHTRAKQVFLGQLVDKNNEPQWRVLWAADAFAKTNPVTHESYVVLKQGHVYQGIPGEADYQVASFDEYEVRLPHPIDTLKEDIRTLNTASLWPLNNPDRKKAAELQWRLSVPIMVFTLTLIAVPLSRVNPRAGKFAKLLPAIVIYSVYANFMFILRDWVAAGKLPIGIGVWWLHIAAALLGLGLMWRQRVRLS